MIHTNFCETFQCDISEHRDIQELKSYKVKVKIITQVFKHSFFIHLSMCCTYLHNIEHALIMYCTTHMYPVRLIIFRRWSDDAYIYSCHDHKGKHILAQNWLTYIVGFIANTILTKSWQLLPSDRTGNTIHVFDKYFHSGCPKMQKHRDFLYTCVFYVKITKLWVVQAALILLVFRAIHLRLPYINKMDIFTLIP